MDFESLRREYLKGGLSREDLADNPHTQFSGWMQQALEMGIGDPTAMTLATVSEAGQPSQRIVLLKHFDTDGLVFYTNYNSRKAHELMANPNVSLHFPWHGIDRQVKIGGTAEKISAAQSLKYFISNCRSRSSSSTTRICGGLAADIIICSAIGTGLAIGIASGIASGIITGIDTDWHIAAIINHLFKHPHENFTIPIIRGIKSLLNATALTFGQ